MKSKNIPLFAIFLALIVLSINCGTLNIGLATPIATASADTDVAGGGVKTAAAVSPQPTPSKTVNPTATSAALPTVGTAIHVHAELRTILDVNASHVLFSPDGKSLFLGYRELRVYDAQSLAEIRSIPMEWGVSGFAISPDGKILAVIEGSSGVTLYDAASGSELRTLPRSGISTSAASNSFLAFTPDSGTLAAIIGEVVKLFDVASGEETGTIVADSPFNIAISPDGKSLYAGGWMDEIQVWDIASGEMIRSFGEKSRGTNRMILSPDGSLLVSAGTFTEPMILWDTATGRQLRTFSGHTDSVTSLAFSPDGRLLASAANDVTIKLWDTATGQTLQTLTGHTQAPQDITISPDGGTLVSASQDGTTRLWTLSEGRSDLPPTATVAEGPGPDLRPTPIPLSAQAITVDNAAQVKRLSIIDMNESKIVVWSPDGKWLVVAGRTIHFLDAASYKEIRSANFQMDGLAVSPDSKILAAVGYPGVVLFNLADGSELRTLERTSAHTTATSNGFLAFSPDSATIAAVVGDVVKVYDVASGQEKATITANRPFNIAVSPDGRSLYTSGWMGEIQVWDIASGALVRSFGDRSRSVNRMALSPDGSLLVSAGTFTEPMILWDTATGRQLRTFSGHTDSVTSLAFSPDGKVLFSSARDVTIKLWDVANGNLLASLVGHTQAPESIAVSPDGDTLSSTSYNDGVFLWGLPPG
jgi:WD40 repeat protein